MPKLKKSVISFSKWLIPAISLIILALLAGGVWFYVVQRDRLHAEAEEDLDAVARLKADQIVQWRSERLADAAALMENPYSAEALGGWVSDRRGDSTEKVLTLLRSLRAHHDYNDIILVNNSGHVLLSLSGLTGNLDREASRAVGDSQREQKALLSELTIGTADQGPHIDAVSPLKVGDGVGGKSAENVGAKSAEYVGAKSAEYVGAVILRCEARDFLYPLLQSWPLRSRTGETLLVRRDGNDVLYLNDLRYQPRAALSLRIPLSRSDVAAVAAVTGKEGVFEGNDYRGNRVTAVLKAIPGSFWFIVAKEDTAEFLAPWRFRAFLILALILGLAAAAAGVALRHRAEASHFRARLLAETARRESEERYRIALLSVGDGVIATDAQGKVEFLNPVAEALTGWSQAEAKGSGLEEVFRIVNEDTRDPAENPVARIVREGAVAGLANHTVLIDRSGKEHSIADSGALIKSEAGQILGIVLVFRDVTGEERNRTEHETTLQLLRLLNEPNLTHELIQNVTRLLQAWTGCEAVGVRLREGDDYPYFETRGFPAEFVEAERFLCERDPAGQVVRDGEGRPVLECMCGNILRGRFDPRQPFFTAKGSFWSNGTTDLLARTTEADRQARTRNRCNREGYESVALIRLRNGDETLGLLQLNDGRRGQFTPELITFLENVADQIAIGLSQRQTEAARQLLASAIEQAGEIIVITDPLGSIQYVNAAFESVTGYLKGEALGRNPRMLKSGEHEPAFYKDLWNTISGGKVWSGNLVNRKKDGTRYTEDATISPVHDAHGKIVNYVAVKHDSTHERHLEDQLRQAQKMESVGQLAGGVAHDFNNMLQVISSYVELSLAEVDVGHVLHKNLQQIQKAARRSAELTGQLLAFARKQTVSPRVLDVNDAVAGTLKMLQRLIGEDIDLAWMPGHSAGKIRIDPSQLDQILANLAVNARDAIAGVGKLTIGTDTVVIDEKYCADHPGHIPGTFVLLTVSDDGSGMSKETLPHIFEPFFTTKGVGEGTGLGLATVYGIINQNNGFINVYSELGQGTTFKIYLPCHEGEAAAVQAQKSADEPPTGTETVLVVEDEAAILELSKLMLENLGYTVLTARTPREATQLVTEHAGAIHLLITDVVMPQMNGRDLALLITEVKPGLKVLFMSGYTADVIAHQGLLDADVSFISKPFAMNTLAEKIRAVLR